MLANRVRELTTTTGTGDLTLAGALAGHIGFGDAFSADDRITYVIEDGDNYEIGNGTFTAAGAIERTEVLETLENGSYTTSGAVAISLSGNARVFCAATSQFLLSATEAADTITEATDGAGVTVDGVLIRDGSVEINAQSGTALTVSHPSLPRQDFYTGSIRQGEIRYEGGSFVLQSRNGNDINLFADTGGSILLSNGAVGIGRTDPGYMLDVHNAAGGQIGRFESGGTLTNGISYISFDVDGSSGQFGAAGPGYTSHGRQDSAWMHGTNIVQLIDDAGTFKVRTTGGGDALALTATQATFAGDFVSARFEATDTGTPTDPAFRLAGGHGFYQRGASEVAFAIDGEDTAWINDEGAYFTVPVFATGNSEFSRDSAAPVYIKRTGTPGDQLIFHDNGSTTGTLGYNGSEFYIGWGGGNGAVRVDSNNDVTIGHKLRQGTVVVGDVSTDADNIAIGGTGASNAGLSIVSDPLSGRGILYFTDGQSYQNQGGFIYSNEHDRLAMLAGQAEVLHVTSTLLDVKTDTVIAGNANVAGALSVSKTTGAGVASATFDIVDNTDANFVVKQGANSYLDISTLNGAEAIIYGSADVAPAHTFYGDVGIGVSPSTHRLEVHSSTDASIANFGRVSGAGWINFNEGGTLKGYLGYEAGGGGIATNSAADAMVVRSTAGPVHIVGGQSNANLGLTVASDTITFGRDLVANHDATFKGIVDLDRGGSSFALKPGTLDHVYMSFYAETASPEARSGFLGFGTAGNATMTLKNERTGGSLRLATVGGDALTLGADLSATFAGSIQLGTTGTTQPILSRNSGGGLTINANGVIASANRLLEVSEGGVTRFDIDGNGNATFSSDLAARDGFFRNSAGGRVVLDDSDMADTSQPIKFMASIDGELILGTANRNASGGTTGSTALLTFGTDNSATFAGDVILGSGTAISVVGSNTIRRAGAITYDITSVATHDFRVNGASQFTVAEGEAAFAGNIALAQSKSVEFVGANSGLGYGHRFIPTDTGTGATLLKLQSRNNSASWTDQVTFRSDDGSVEVAGDMSLLQTAGNSIFTVQSGEGSWSQIKFQGDLTGTEYVLGRNDVSDFDTFVIGRDGGFNDFVLDSTGKVGIGDTAPSSQLSVQNDVDNTTTWWTDASAGVLIRNANADGDSILKFSNVPTGRIVYGTSNSADQLIFSSRLSAGTTANDIVFDADGNIGIGEKSPSRPLHITDETPYIRLEDNDGSSSLYAEMFSNAAGDLVMAADAGAQSSGSFRVFVNGSEEFSIASGGDATFGGELSVSGSDSIRTITTNRLGVIGNGAGLGTWESFGRNSVGSSIRFGRIIVIADEVTGGTEAGTMRFSTVVDGALVDHLDLGSSGATFLGDVIARNADASETRFVADNIGTGDATFRWRIDGSTRANAGVDRSDGNKFKIAPNSIGVSDWLALDPSDLSATFAGDVLAGGSAQMTADLTTSALVSSGSSTATSSGLMELHGWRTAADGGRVGVVSFHNHNSTDTGRYKRVATIEGWTTGTNAEAGQLRFMVHSGTSFDLAFSIASTTNASFTGLVFGPEFRATNFVKSGFGSESLPSITFSNQNNMGAWRKDGLTYAISTGGEERLSISNTLLTVSADAEISGGLSVGAIVNHGAMALATVVNGEITVNKRFTEVDTDSGAQVLHTISGGTAGDEITLSPSSSVHTLTVQDIDAGGNIHIAGQFVMTSPSDTLTLFFTGTTWREIARSNNG